VPATETVDTRRASKGATTSQTTDGGGVAGVPEALMAGSEGLAGVWWATDRPKPRVSDECGFRGA